jgi:hypothetical protein
MAYERKNGKGMFGNPAHGCHITTAAHSLITGQHDRMSVAEDKSEFHAHHHRTYKELAIPR